MTARIVETEIAGSGGSSARHGFLFEVTGGELCLDLANTIDCRPTDSPKERLGTYGDLAAWGEQAGAIESGEARRLISAARRHPAAAGAALRRARALREALFSIFSAVADGNVPRAAVVELLNDELARALRHARLVAVKDNDAKGSRAAGGAPFVYRYGWGGSTDDLDRILWPVARSAAELLTDDRLSRIRECAAGNCAWLFLDTSRNRSRRWCDMTVCGNREKAQRHYRRSRKPN